MSYKVVSLADTRSVANQNCFQTCVLDLCFRIGKVEKGDLLRGLKKSLKERQPLNHLGFTHFLTESFTKLDCRGLVETLTKLNTPEMYAKLEYVATFISLKSGLNRVADDGFFLLCNVGNPVRVALKDLLHWVPDIETLQEPEDHIVAKYFRHLSDHLFMDVVEMTKLSQSSREDVRVYKYVIVWNEENGFRLRIADKGVGTYSKVSHTAMILTDCIAGGGEVRVMHQKEGLRVDWNFDSGRLRLASRKLSDISPQDDAIYKSGKKLDRKAVLVDMSENSYWNILCGRLVDSIVTSMDTANSSLKSSLEISHYIFADPFKESK